VRGKGGSGQGVHPRVLTLGLHRHARGGHEGGRRANNGKSSNGRDGAHPPREGLGLQEGAYDKNEAGELQLASRRAVHPTRQRLACEMASQRSV
jgi:hypothetical protein